MDLYSAESWFESLTFHQPNLFVHGSLQSLLTNADTLFLPVNNRFFKILPNSSFKNYTDVLHRTVTITGSYKKKISTLSCIKNARNLLPLFSSWMLQVPHNSC